MRWSINKNSLFSPESMAHGTSELLFGLPSPDHIRERDRLWVTLSNDSLSLMQLLDVDVDMLKGEKNELSGELAELKNLSDEQMKEMLLFANAAASIITTRKGALRVMPTKEEVENLIDKISK